MLSRILVAISRKLLASLVDAHADVGDDVRVTVDGDNCDSIFAGDRVHWVGELRGLVGAVVLHEEGANLAEVGSLGADGGHWLREGLAVAAGAPQFHKRTGGKRLGGVGVAWISYIVLGEKRGDHGEARRACHDGIEWLRKFVA